MKLHDRNVLFSSKKMDWSTPPAFFDTLNEEFNFTLDACASSKNNKCDNFFTTNEDSLIQSWEGNTVFCNPPYGSGIKHWVKKCFEEGQKPKTKVVMLIPSRTDTRYWHDYVMRSQRIYFIKGRLKFGGSDTSAPFPSAVVVFDGTGGSPDYFPIVKALGNS